MEKSSSSISEMEKDTIIEFLRKENSKLNEELIKMKKILQEYELDDVEVKVTDTELICLQQIKKLKDLSNNVILNKDEVSALDTLYKNLRICTGELVTKDKEVKKIKKMSNKDLLKLVN